MSKKFDPEFDLAKYEGSGEYRYSPAAAYWKAWQARAALAQPSPAAVQLSVSRERRIYVAGPMTGYKDFNFPAFNAQAEELRGLGYHVENPAEHGIVDGAEWQDYLRYDIGRLSTCEAIFLLPGWSKSKGAALEVHIAKALGMTFIHHADAEHEQPSPAQAEQAEQAEAERPEVVAWRYGFSGGIVSDKACLDEWKSGGEQRIVATHQGVEVETVRLDE
ncbi:TPA: DUF4406 domain-containing protein [Pseudomonas aeruginosa]|nr:DUF4406 domain-containing protein [Pseudomonas aeruginosa]